MTLMHDSLTGQVRTGPVGHGQASIRLIIPSAQMLEPLFAT
jgi:hypothetical protein